MTILFVCFFIFAQFENENTIIDHCRERTQQVFRDVYVALGMLCHPILFLGAGLCGMDESGIFFMSQRDLRSLIHQCF